MSESVKIRPVIIEMEKRCRAIFNVCAHFWKDYKYVKLEKGRYIYLDR